MALTSIHYYILFLIFSFTTQCCPTVCQNTQLNILMTIKASLDPHNTVLSTWRNDSVNPCGDNSFEGVACNENGNVVNISLQGKGLHGTLPPQIGLLESLSGLYLHFNGLSGNLPLEISNLTELTELYLNVNNFSGEIPSRIGTMANLQVLQLCNNMFSGRIPTQLSSLKKLSALSLQHNNLTGAIPASLGELGSLTRMDLSYNDLSGSIPVKLANAPMLKVLDIRNNTLSGSVPSALKRLNDGFRYENNPRLCGIGFSLLTSCTADLHTNQNRPEPFGQINLPAKDIPQSANLNSSCIKSDCSSSSKKSRIPIMFAIIGLFTLSTFVGLIAFSRYRRNKQKIGNSFDSSDTRLSTDQAREVYTKSGSPLVSIEYSNGWDPLAKSRNGVGFSQEVFESFMFNLEEVESATQHFSEMNLLGKSSFSAVYKGVLRNGSVVAIKCIAKSSCQSDEPEFLKGLRIVTMLKQENLVKLRGFCCSKGRGECFLIYDFIQNGNLLQYLDLKYGSGKVLQWPTRISIIHGIAKGIGYLHGNKPAIVHQNISAEKVHIDQRYNPLLSDSGLHKLLADDIVFSTLKSSAAMGYLAPEYTTTGRFTEKSDVYAFGMIIFQILSGRKRITQVTRNGAESCRFEEFIDPNLQGKYSEPEATKLGKIALHCTDDSPNHRPSMVNVMQQLHELS